MYRYLSRLCILPGITNGSEVSDWPSVFPTWQVKVLLTRLDSSSVIVSTFYTHCQFPNHHTCVHVCPTLCLTTNTCTYQDHVHVATGILPGIVNDCEVAFPSTFTTWQVKELPTRLDSSSVIVSTF